MPTDDDGKSATDPELARALLYVHDKLAVGLRKQDELSSHVYALTESLIASGLVKRVEVEKRRALVQAQMVESARTHWEGAEVLHDESDKYAAESSEIDCAARAHLCKAACCRLDFTLSRQDLAEGVVRWDVGRPYRIRQRADGWCNHCDPTTKACGVHAYRPLVCRQYDCRRDTRIWEDFAGRIPNPLLAVLR
jgi:Fe-S-cluster containining protein